MAKAYNLPARLPSVPPKPVHARPKHVGYMCTKCQEEKYFTLTKLCGCLLFTEDPKRIRAHINTFWIPLYADFPGRPSWG